MNAKLRFHLDEHIDTAVARALKRAGVDVTTTVQANMRTLADTAHRAHATGEARVLVTCDRDFLAMHAENQEHAGIVFFPQSKRSIGQIVEKILALHAARAAEDMFGQVIYG